MQKLFSWFTTTLLLVLVCVPLLSSGCTGRHNEGFAIYLTRDDIPPARMEALSHIDISDQPFISLQDVITYNAQTHELKLTQSAFERISQLSVPVEGKSFVVCVDRQPVYWGAFWTPISSISFDGVTIWKPYSSAEPYIVTLELGYPSSSFYGGADPRNSPEILHSLEQVGKLITKLSLTEVSVLPRSMKGYELYSWSENDVWHFTLITGTNRNKTLAEIVSDPDFISEVGWIQIHVASADAIETALGKLPRGEDVYWLSSPSGRLTTTDSTRFSLPPESTLDSIKAFAIQRGLNLQIM